MQITIEIDEALLIQAAQSATRQVYRAADTRWHDVDYAGEGFRAVYRQAVAWSQQQEYTAMIAEIAPAIIRDVLADAVRAAVAAHIRAAVRQMRADGALGALVARERDHE